MNKYLKHSLFCVSFLPFLMGLPYCFQAMRNSPAERWNWLLLPAVAVMLVLACTAPATDTPTRRRPWLLACLVPPLALLAFGYFRHIHLAVLLAGIALPWCMAICFLPWRRAALFLPAAAMLTLFLPSVGTILAMLAHCDALLAKTLLALAIATIGVLWRILPRTIPRPSSLLFAMTILALLAGYQARGYALNVNPPLQPTFDNLLRGEFRGIRETAIEQDRQFFGDSQIDRLVFQNRHEIIFNILIASKLDNIEKIHPANYCLRVGGYRILEERIVSVPGTQAEALELLAERNGRRRLFWQWFSTPERSTASFLLFRSLYSGDDAWTMYLVDAPVDRSRNETAELLADFLRTFSMR